MNIEQWSRESDLLILALKLSEEAAEVGKAISQAHRHPQVREDHLAHAWVELSHTRAIVNRLRIVLNE